MEEEYVKEVKIIELNEIEKEKEVLNMILETKKELELARKNFEYSCEDDLIDYYSYSIKASQSKLDYLIKLAKAKGIQINGLDKIKYNFVEKEVG